MREKRFTYMGSNSLRNNAFFVKNELINQLSLDSIDLKNLNSFTNARYRECKSETSNLKLLNPDQNLNIIKECKVFDLKTNKIFKIKELI